MIEIKHMYFSIVQLITIMLLLLLREHRDCLQIKVIAVTLHNLLRTSNYHIIDLYDILIVGFIVVASHTHFCFVCKCILIIFQNSERSTLSSHFTKI